MISRYRCRSAAPAATPGAFASTAYARWPSPTPPTHCALHTRLKSWTPVLNLPRSWPCHGPCATRHVGPFLFFPVPTLLNLTQTLTASARPSSRSAPLLYLRAAAPSNRAATCVIFFWSDVCLRAGLTSRSFSLPCLLCPSQATRVSGCTVMLGAHSNCHGRARHHVAGEPVNAVNAVQRMTIHTGSACLLDAHMGKTHAPSASLGAWHPSRIAQGDRFLG